MSAFFEIGENIMAVLFVAILIAGEIGCVFFILSKIKAYMLKIRRQIEKEYREHLEEAKFFSNHFYRAINNNPIKDDKKVVSQMNLEDRIAVLEKRVADLEGQVQNQPTMEDFLDKASNLFHAFAITLHCANYIEIPCECGRNKHDCKAAFCTNCGRKLVRPMGETQKNAHDQNWSAHEVHIFSQGENVGNVFKVTVSNRKQLLDAINKALDASVVEVIVKKH